ncbi:hypothetical protein [Paludisphaera rhizosphaerae]|uniref:hypothetical protein n=1 Tax=Paludisphaera rhizosphaerae TaxID=2711216 RepID=UPI0013EDDB50|nr:hypothetical protein [Paludisphaera rhizosphaerae]
MTPEERVASFIRNECLWDPSLFNEVILGGMPYWSGKATGVQGQKEWAEAVCENAETVLVTGNNLGKSTLAHSLICWWACTRPHSTVLVFAPSLATILENTWSGIGKILGGYTYQGKEYKPRINLGAKISRGGSARPNIVFPNGSRIIGIAANKEENCSGFHSSDLFVVVEEGSGIPQFVFDALGGLGPRRTLIVGNPLSINTGYYQRYLTALESEKKGIPPASSSRAIRVPSTASPHSHLDHSPWGIADKTFLDRKRNEEGENSFWFRTHVLSEWPTTSSEILIPIEDLDYAISEECRVAAQAYRDRAKPGENKVYISCDVGGGVGKSASVLVVRDSYGVISLKADDMLGVEGAASEVARLKHTYNVPDSHISYDGGGDIGSQMAAALKREGVHNPWPYFGGDLAVEFSKHFANARSACAFTLARRLARGYFIGVEHGAPFYIPPDKELVEELKALRGVARGDGRSALIEKEELQRILKRSPDTFDALSQSFVREARRK